MALAVNGFDWDDGNREKCRKHGVSRAEIEAVFQRPISVFPDPAHSSAEERFIAIGTNEKGRYIFIAFTLRRRKGETLMRPISARYMRQKEVGYYEEEAAKAKE
ncbi:MAG: BrnT family toxin [Stellaceae bacterium]